MWFLTIFYFLSILIVIISLELTRVNPDQNMFLINVELTSTFYKLQRFGPSPSPNLKWLLLLRGENGPTCYALAPIPGDPEKCLFRWILDTDLKVGY